MASDNWDETEAHRQHRRQVEMSDAIYFALDGYRNGKPLNHLAAEYGKSAVQVAIYLDPQAIRVPAQTRLQDL